MGRFAPFWCGGGRGPLQSPEAFVGRTFVKLAMFWRGDLWESAAFERVAPTLRPEEAHQHGRLYLPRDGAPALVISTDFVQFDPTTEPPSPVARPIPASPNGFTVSCLPGAQALAVARSLGVPGL
jgi:hypothetical protein